MKIGSTRARWILAAVVLGVLTTSSPVRASDAATEEPVQVESAAGNEANGGSGIAAAILCGGLSRMAVTSGMNVGIASAAIAACAYMMLDGFFGFPW